MKSRHSALLDKSLQAALSAIELYNKPNFSYREESFSILMVNAWELLLKAKKIQDNNGKIQSLYITEYKKKNNGDKSKKPTYKTNRSGNYLTISIMQLLSELQLDPNLKTQIETLIEIRDSSVHYMNSTKLFEKEFIGIAAASLKSYQTLMYEWFNQSLADYNLSLIPLTFNTPDTFDVQILKNSSEAHKKLLGYIGKQKSKAIEQSEHDISLVIEIKLERGSKGIGVSFGKDGTPVFIDTEETFRNKYPLSFDQLKEQLKTRYNDFSTNNAFWKLKKQLESDEKLSGERYLDYEKKSGMKKRYYSSNILKEFDKHYTKK